VIVHARVHYVYAVNRPASLWFKSTEFELTDTPAHRRNVLFYNKFITFSHYCEKLHSHRYFSIIRRLCWPIAFCVMASEAPRIHITASPTESAFYILDILVNVFFSLDSLFRLCGFALRVLIEKACNREMTVRGMILKSGSIDIIVTFLCFAYQFTTTGLWFRLLRLLLITASAMEMFPQMDVLMVR
jgi:hypothetical protein